jgi:mRNA-degrading endonuclease RelE of RelBE toxin-antitoxin system
MDETLLHFIETDIFTKQIDRLASRETLLELQNILVINPERGAVIQGTHGARKARIGDKQQNRGKSGAFRFIYLYLEKAETIYLPVFFGENEKDNLSKEEQNEIGELVKQLKDIYGE